MSCSFTIECIDIPKSLKEQVENLIKECDLEYVLHIEESPDEMWVDEPDDYMSFSTATRITDDFLPAIAKLLAGTPQDGQCILTECDGERAYHILVNGEIKNTYELDRFLDGFPGELGLITTVDLQAEIIHLPAGRVLVTKLKKKGGVRC